MNAVVTVEGIAAGGDGVGRLPDGMTVFVPRTAPGDEVEVTVGERKARWARGRALALKRPSGDRTQPTCPHYEGDDCGGCQLQHMEYAAQLEAKRRLVGDALRRIGRRTVDDPPITPAPAQWRYRAKISLAIADGTIGLHPYDHPNRVFALHDCHITRTPLMALWHALAGARAQVPAGATGIVLREDREGGLHVLVVGGDTPWDAEALATAVGVEGVTYWWQPARGAPRALAGGSGAFPITAFAQVNPTLADRIRRDAVEALGALAGKTVWDLYGGVGDAARLLAAAGACVWSVDADRTAIAWAERHEPSADAPERAPRYIAARVEESLHRLPEPDAILLNPPRAGAHRAVTGALERWASQHRGARIAYVSCDPATLGRDLSRLPTLGVVRLAAYDLFPQTSHVETLAVLEAA